MCVEPEGRSRCAWAVLLEWQGVDPEAECGVRGGVWSQRRGVELEGHRSRCAGLGGASGRTRIGKGKAEIGVRETLLRQVVRSVCGS